MSRVVSGMRPTGRLHLGNYFGALKNWVDLQSQHDCAFFVADWHMFTTGYEDTTRLPSDVSEMVLDWLGAGLDPHQCLVFKQSDIPEHAELALLLGMVTPLSWLENNPTWKEQLQELAKTKDTLDEKKAAGPQSGVHKHIAHELRTYGFLGYPVLQAADILIHGGERVPVGQDQLPHLELTREIARKFNSLYGNVLPEPQPILTSTPKLPGTDGRKMSKSYGNTVELLESKDSLVAKVRSMYTDPKKVKKDTPGHPDPGPENPPGCVVYALHKLYTPGWEKIGEECRAGQLGCMDDKLKRLMPSLEGPFDDFGERRQKYSGKDVEEILAQGAQKARAGAQKTMKEVRKAMRIG
jgi:tryptophanyl-tRNA synthetase